MAHLVVGGDNGSSARRILAVEWNEAGRAALVISVIGGWLFYLDAADKGSYAAQLRDTMLSEWSTRWAAVLDARQPGD